MRVHLLALSALVAQSNAFAPLPTNNVQGVVAQPSSTSLSMKSSDFDNAKKSILSVFAASTIFLASATTPAFIDPALAAATPPPPPATTTTATTAKIAPKVIDPLQAEKSALENAKKAATAANVEVTKAKKALGDANTALSKSTETVAAADKKVAASKKALITANDKLADAKARESKKGDMSALKEVEKLASKVGTYLTMTMQRC